MWIGDYLSKSGLWLELPPRIFSSRFYTLFSPRSIGVLSGWNPYAGRKSSSKCPQRSPNIRFIRTKGFFSVGTLFGDRGKTTLSVGGWARSFETRRKTAAVRSANRFFQKA